MVEGTDPAEAVADAPPNASIIVLTPLTTSMKGPPESLEVKYIEPDLPEAADKLPTLTHYEDKTLIVEANSATVESGLPLP